MSKALLRVERKEGKRNLTSKSSHVTNTISGDERQCPVSGYQTDYCVIALLSQRVKVEDFEKKFVKLLC